MDQKSISQTKLAEEWGNVSGKTRYQQSLNKMLQDKDRIDSISLITALSNLSKIRISDILNEISLSDNKILYANESKGKYKKDAVSIPITNIRSAASALMTAYNPETDIDGEITVPKNWVKPGVHKVGSISGESMMSTFSPNDLIACRLMENFEWEEIRENYVYEIVTKDNESIIKRVRPNLDRGFITCMSDNLDKQNFPNFNIEVSEIAQIWEVEFKVSWKFPSPYQAVEDRFNHLEKSQDELSHVITAIYKEMKSLKEKQREMLN
jgi:hypothetical protein